MKYPIDSKNFNFTSRRGMFEVFRINWIFHLFHWASFWRRFYRCAVLIIFSPLKLFEFWFCFLLDGLFRALLEGLSWLCFWNWRSIYSYLFERINQHLIGSLLTSSLQFPVCWYVFFSVQDVWCQNWSCCWLFWIFLHFILNIFNSFLYLLLWCKLIDF